jgi:hypothetical protein
MAVTAESKKTVLTVLLEYEETERRMVATCGGEALLINPGQRD